MNNKYLRFSILTFLGTWFVYKLYTSADGNFVFDFLVFFFVGGLGFGFHIWSAFKDNKEYTTTKLLISKIPYFLPLDTLNRQNILKANYITEIDKNGQELDEQSQFRITVDNRNNHQRE